MLLVVHIVFGTSAIGSGLVALVTEKGGRRHRAAGRVFAASMLCVLVTAAMLTLMTRNLYLAALTVGAGAPAFSGWRVLRRKRPDIDPAQRATVLDWTASIVLLVTALILVRIAVGNPSLLNRGLVLALGGSASAHMTYDLWRFANPTRWPRGPRVWLFEHLVRMVATFSAALAAFSGSVLVLFDPPWRQLWAVLLGQFLTVVLLWRYRRGLRARRVRGGEESARAA
jgi:membrane protein implicated in regulation of membrane protease activity